MHEHITQIPSHYVSHNVCYTTKVQNRDFRIDIFSENLERSGPFRYHSNFIAAKFFVILPVKEGGEGWNWLIFAKVLVLDGIMTKQLRNEYLRKI